MSPQKTMRDRDAQLIAKLGELQGARPWHYSVGTGLRFANRELAGRARQEYSADELADIEALLKAKGALSLPVIEGCRVAVGGVERDLTIMAATDPAAHHGDMSSMLYLRDQVQASAALMELHLHDPARYAAEGQTARALLMSALHLMSTPAQLARFRRVVRLGPAAGQADWPAISLRFDNLDASRPNQWRNKQDSFQMLAYLTLDAIERGWLDPGDLAAAHRQFLGSAPLLLAAVGFPRYGSSGSWEELTAVRTSVIAVETALLHKAQALSRADPALRFLRGGLGPAELDALLQDGLHELGRRLPDESPDYPARSIKYRAADAALAYVLRYGLPDLLAAAQVPIGPQAKAMSAAAIEELILKQLAMLDDPLTNGMYRYLEDSYQRVNFHTHEVQYIIASIKQEIAQTAATAHAEPDLDRKQLLRGQLTPLGRQAAWTHPLGQLAAWAVRRRPELAAAYLNRALSLVTGDNQWHATLQADGTYAVRPVPAYRLPECYVTYQPPIGPAFTVPSPHTPLNWSTAMLREAIGMAFVAARETARVPGGTTN